MNASQGLRPVHTIEHRSKGKHFYQNPFQYTSLVGVWRAQQCRVNYETNYLVPLPTQRVKYARPQCSLSSARSCIKGPFSSFINLLFFTIVVHDVTHQILQTTLS